MKGPGICLAASYTYHLAAGIANRAATRITRLYTWQQPPDGAFGSTLDEAIGFSN